MRLLFLLLLACFSTALSAQIFQPVKWSFHAEHVEGDTYNLIFDAKIDKGWYTYSQHIDEGGPIPTSFTFEEGDHYSLSGDVKESSNAIKEFDKNFEIDVVKFKGYAKFTQKIQAKDIKQRVVGYLTFMTCNDERCLAPEDIDFEITLPPPVSGKSDAAITESSKDLAKHTEKKPAEEKSTDQKTTKAESETKQETIPPPANDQNETSIVVTGDIPSGDEDGILQPVKWSFTYEKVSDDTYTLIANAKIDAGWHIYTQHIDPELIGPTPTTLTFEAQDGVEFVGKPEESGPAKEQGYDKVFEMELVKFKKEARFAQTVRTKGQPTISGEVMFATCNNERCLLPEYIPFSIDLSQPPGTITQAGDQSVTQAAVIDGQTIDQIIPSIVESNKDPVGNCSAGTETAEGKGLLWTFILGFLGGLVALLTPCVFPMIPLTVSFFSKDTKRKGWVNGAIYGVSIIVIYVLIGILITAIFGATALNELSTNWIANTIFFLIFVLFAFSFLGYYEITLPSSWTTKSDQMADKGGFIGIFFMAFTLALVSFSCTGPIIGSALVESATNKMGPFIVMLGFSTALALPFGLFAAFPAWLNSLPRSGSWMNSVKVILGFVELALAFKFLSVADMTSHWNFLRYEIFLGIWVLIAAAMAAYLFGWIKFPHDSPMKKLSIPRAGLATGMAVLTVYLASGFLFNERTQTYNSLAMLSGLAPPAHYNYFRPVPEADASIKSRFPSYSKCANNLDCFHDYYEGVAYAQEVKKPVFLDFTGYGCVNCRKTEEHIWVDDRVWNRLKNDFVMISLYGDDKKPLEPVLVSKSTQKKLRTVGLKWSDFQIVNFGQNSQPLYVIMTPEGEVLTKPRGYHEGVKGYVDFLECGLQVYEEFGTLLGDN